jgi:Flp pilus assembly protein TadG
MFVVSRSFKSVRQAERGSALLEAAIILPVVLALAGGGFEFGFFLYQQQLIVSGVRDAARYLALSADPTSDINQSNARNLAVSGSIQGGPPRVPGWTVSDVSVAVDFADNPVGANSAGPKIPIVTVSTSFVDPSLGLLDLLGLGKPTISASHQERFVGGTTPG